MEKRSKFLGGMVLIAVVALLLPLGYQGEAAGAGFGIMADSSSDEYRADDNRGGAYAEATLNWMELLVRYRGLDFGAWGTRPSPRRSGYEYNWALSGATSGDVISLGQHTGLATQVTAGQVSNVILIIGNNDFAIWNGTYEAIYNGRLTDQQVTGKVNSMISNISLALQTVVEAGADNVFVATLGDRGSIEPFLSTFPDPAGRQRVTNAIMSVNSGIKFLAAQKGVVVIDLYAFASEEIFPLVDANGNLNIGGELISTTQAGDEPHHMLLADNEHGGTVMNGVLANFVIDQLNTRNLGIAKFTDPELIANAGILQPPPDTQSPAVSLTAPYNGATVSGTSRTVSASASDNVGVIGVQFKLDGSNLGTEDTTSPYSISWNTTQTTNGQHVLTAVARDAAGNRTTSTARTVTVNNPVPDTTPPDVSISIPTNNASVSGTINVQASASDNKGVVGVQFKCNGVNLGFEDTTSPYSVGWNTTTVKNGSYELTAIARDAAGNTRTSNINIVVNNPLPDTLPPQVSITSPANNASVSGTISVEASASDNVGVAGLQFRLDGNSLGSEDTTSPYSVSWNTTAVTNGPHTLTAVARDAAGNTFTGASISVTINNPTPQTYFPQSYAVSLGSYQSGNLTSLTSDDNNFLVTKSTSSGWYRESMTDFEFRNVRLPVSRLDYSVTIKSSASSTSATIYAYNFVTASWTQLNTSSIGTSEVTKNVSITSSAASYINTEGKSLIRLKSSKLLGNHSISSDLVSLMATP